MLISTMISKAHGQAHLVYYKGDKHTYEVPSPLLFTRPHTLILSISNIFKYTTVEVFNIRAVKGFKSPR